MADDGRKLRGRYKEYMRHHNPYKFKPARLAARRRSGRINLLKADKNPCPTICQSGNNDQEFDSRGMCDDSYICYCDVNSSVSSGEQMQDTLGKIYSESEEMLDVSLSESELLDFTNTPYERFVTEDDACSQTFSDYEDHEDLELELKQCEPEPDCALYPGAPLTSSSSIVLLLSFVMKHKLTREAFNDLLSVIEAHCPRPNNCKTSVKTLLEFVSQAKEDIQKHYYCGYCKAYFGKGTGNCNICGRSISKADGFFIEVPIEKQLQTFFTDPEFVQGLGYRFQRVKRDDENIEDVYDGAIYQSKCGPGGFLSEPYNLSVKLNTDGVAIFHSSQFGVWPLFLLVNELPPSLRRKNKYRVFGGLWFGEEKPFFSTFFKPFVDTLQETEIHGIEVTLPDGVKRRSKVMALSGHFDLPARAGVLEQVTYTGHDSCSYCEEHGDVVKTGARGHVMTFPFRNTVSGHAELRTAHNVEAHSYSALEICFVGPRYVLMNQHMLLHLMKSVIDHGPLWCSSLFVFEDWNGDIANYFHGTQNVAHQIMTAVTSHQHLPKLIDEMPPGCAKDLVFQLCGRSDRTNRTSLKDDFYAIGALKKGKSTNADYEDDLLLFLGVESISDVTFFSRLQIGEAVFHSREYKRVSRRNNYTIAYQQGDSICYGYIETFFSVRNNPRVACGAVIAPMSMSGQHVCKSHEGLGSPISHIVCLHEPNKNQFTVAPLKDIIDICVYIKFSDCDVSYAAHFPNHIEKD